MRARGDGPWPHLMFSANVVGHMTNDKGVWQLHESLLMQLRQRNHPPLRPGVRLGNDQDKVIAAETFVAQVRRIAGKKSQADIHAAFFQRCLDIG